MKRRHDSYPFFRERLAIGVGVNGRNNKTSPNRSLDRVRYNTRETAVEIPFTLLPCAATAPQRHSVGLYLVGALILIKIVVYATLRDKSV